MQECSNENLGNSAWKIGLLEYLCTLISDSTPSPAELLNNRVYKGFKSFLKPSLSSFQVTKDMVTGNMISLKEKEKINHDKQARDLPKIDEGSDVWYHDHNKDIWEKGTVVEQVKNDRSYTLVNEHGKIVSHNCADLKKHFNKVEQKDHGKIPKPPSLLDPNLVLLMKVTQSLPSMV